MTTMFSGSVILQPGITREEALRGQWGFRLERSTADVLILEPVAANSVAANELAIVPQDASISIDVSTANEMDSAAADAGTLLSLVSADNLLYVYYCATGDFAGGLGVSLTPPTNVDGVYLLGSTGDAFNALFVGYWWGDAAGQVVDTDAERRVSNHYNRRWKRLLARPGYNDNGAATTFGKTANGWAALNSGTDDLVRFILNGTDGAILHASVALGAAPPGTVGVCIYDSDTAESNAAWFPATAANRTTVAMSHAAVSGGTPAKRTVQLYCDTGNLATTFLADMGAGPSGGHDTAITYLQGLVLA